MEKRIIVIAIFRHARIEIILTNLLAMMLLKN